MRPGAAFMQRAVAASCDEVRDSPEFRRILALPQREPQEPPEGWEDQFRVSRDSFLRPTQRIALWELYQYRGLFGLVGVGHGKTLISLLAGTVLGADRTVLLIPPALKPQLLERDYPHWAQHWRLPTLNADHDPDWPTPWLAVVPYSMLSSKKHFGILDRLRPTLVVADEAHNVAGHSVRTRRYRKYCRRSGALCVDLSGTMIKRKIAEGAPMAELALGEGSPYPRDYQTIQEWGWALDAGLPMNSEPGVLRQFCDPGASVREGFRRRVVSTPGVVATQAQSCDASLYYQERKVRIPPSVTAALKVLRETWTLPDGTELASPLEFYRYARQLAQGLWLRWASPAPAPWMEARRNWVSERSLYVKRGARGLDSPGLVEDAMRSGALTSTAWEQWSALASSYKPRTEAVWVDEFLAKDAAAWAQERRGVVWAKHPAFGARVAELAGLEWYGGGPKADRALLKVGKASIVCSMDSHGTGKELQMYDEQLFTYVSGSGDRWEQNVGRLHRMGQEADQVNVWLYLHTDEYRSALRSASEDARYVYETQGQYQKLLSAGGLTQQYEVGLQHHIGNGMNEVFRKH